MRAGIGYDAHPLMTGRKLILGGVEVPFEKGLDGYSDADVLVHAIMDALLGAAAVAGTAQEKKAAPNKPAAAAKPAMDEKAAMEMMATVGLDKRARHLVSQM